MNQEEREIVETMKNDILEALRGSELIHLQLVALGRVAEELALRAKEQLEMKDSSH